MLINAPAIKDVAAKKAVNPAAGEIELYPINSKFSQVDSNGKAIDLTNNIDSYTAFQTWSFVNDTEGWTGGFGTVVWDGRYGGCLLVSDTSATQPCQVISPPSLSIDGSVHTKVRVEVQRLAGLDWMGTSGLVYTTDAHTFLNTFRKVIARPVQFDTAGDTVIVEFDMENLSNGGIGTTNDWMTSIITRIRLDFGASTATDNQYLIKWISVGSSSEQQIPSNNQLSLAYALAQGAYSV